MVNQLEFQNQNPEEIDAPLILDLIEGLYLLENKKITITKSKKKVYNRADDRNLQKRIS